MMRPAAGICCVARTTGRMLLLRRSAEVASPHLWGFPGGRIDPGEGALQAAVRELCEETGYEGRLRVLGHQPYKHRERTFHCFICEVPSQFRVRLNWEHTDFGWFDPRASSYCGSKHALPRPLHLGVRRLLGSVGVV